MMFVPLLPGHLGRLSESFNQVFVDSGKEGISFVNVIDVADRHRFAEEADARGGEKSSDTAVVFRKNSESANFINHGHEGVEVSSSVCELAFGCRVGGRLADFEALVAKTMARLQDPGVRVLEL